MTQRFQDPSQEFHLSKSPSDARPKSSCTALRASCAAARKISPTATLRMMPDAPERQGNSEETQRSRLECEKTRSRQQKISRLSQTVQDIHSIGKDCIKYQSKDYTNKPWFQNYWGRAWTKRGTRSLTKDTTTKQNKHPPPIPVLEVGLTQLLLRLQYDAFGGAKNAQQNSETSKNSQHVRYKSRKT